MANGLRTDYILLPAQAYDPMRKPMNQLALEQQRSALTSQQLQQEAQRQKNVLGQRAIERRPVMEKAAALELYGNTRHLATPETWNEYRAIFEELGAPVPETFDPAWVRANDDEALKLQADITRANAKAAADETRKQKAFEASERRKQQAFKAEQERKLKEAEAKKGEDKKDRQLDWAESFVEKLSRETGSDEFSSILAAAIAGNPLDTSQVERGRAALAPEIVPLYDRAIEILSKEYGVPAIKTQSGRMVYDPATQTLKPK